MARLTKAERRRRIQLWVDALRSGKYRQTTGMLHRKNGGYCCLGVACDVYRLETERGSWDVRNACEGADGADFVVKSDRDAAVMPSDVRRWFGFDTSDPEVLMPDGDTARLAILNDENRFRFKKIAQLIEKTYL